MAKESYLTLGWEVTSTQDPRYWLDNNARPGSQLDTDLFRVPSHTLANHAAIIAQSGSGKSFFLGRLIEEIMLRTKARCLILDPNADFRKVYEVEDADLWQKASYRVSERRGKLPHESSKTGFASPWSKVAIRIRGGVGITGHNSEQLRLWWPALDMAFLAEDVDPMLRSDLYHCHAFVRALGGLLEYRYLATEKSTNLIDAAQKIFRQGRGMEKTDFREALGQEYNATRLFGKALNKFSSPFEGWIELGHSLVIKSSLLESSIERFIDGALTVSEYVSQDIERFYFGKAREYQAAGILQTDAKEDPWSRYKSNRLEVIDLPSMPDKDTRLLAINALLTTEWERARSVWSHALERPANKDDRVPTFIVVDEAHNLISNEPRTKAETALREQFRTIVAEGRKYGLFLVLVSQRPDKLDSLVLSECENKAIMRLGSGSVLKIARRMLGLDDLPANLLGKCLEFETGRVLMAGRWAPDGPQIIYCAARRTVEGGRNLRLEYWAIPSEDELGKVKETKRRARANRSQKASMKSSKRATK